MLPSICQIDYDTDHYGLLNSVKLAGPPSKVVDYFLKLFSPRSERFNCEDTIEMPSCRNLNEFDFGFISSELPLGLLEEASSFQLLHVSFLPLNLYGILFVTGHRGDTEGGNIGVKKNDKF